MATLLDHPDLTPEQRKNLILNYLPPDIDEKYLKDVFSRLGAVEYVRIIRDKVTQRSMGYASPNILKQNLLIVLSKNLMAFKLERRSCE